MESYDWKVEQVVFPDGRPGVVCHFYDLSERQRYESALRESEERFRGLYQNATIGFYRTTPDHRILMANPAALRMLARAVRRMPMAAGPRPNASV